MQFNYTNHSLIYSTDCGIVNCILCDKVDMKCIQCRAGYCEDNGKCSGE